MSPMRIPPSSSSDEKTKALIKRSSSSSFACKECGKKFPTQQAMAGHCSGHTRTTAAAVDAARRVAAARRLLSSPLLPVVVTMRLFSVLSPLTPLQYYILPPPSQIDWFHRLLSPPRTATTQVVDVADDVTTLRLGSGDGGGRPPLPNQGRRGKKRVMMMDGGDDQVGNKKGKGPMDDGLDLELRL